MWILLNYIVENKILKWKEINNRYHDSSSLREGVKINRYGWRDIRKKI